MEGAEFFAVVQASLQGTVGNDVNVELDETFRGIKPYAGLADEKQQQAFDKKLEKIVSEGLVGRRESLASYLLASTRARDSFSESVSRIVVELSPPARVKKSAQDVNVLWDNNGTLTIALKHISVAAGKAMGGFGAEIDSAMSLCALTDGYIDKANVVIAQSTASASAQCAALAETQVDWTFVQHPNYVKLDEKSRSSVVTNVGKAVKDGLLDRRDGLAQHLARSQRAQSLFSSSAGHLEFVVDSDNRCKTPMDLQEGAGVLRIMVKLSEMVKGAVKGGWGELIDTRLALQVDDEEGMRQAEATCVVEANALPRGTTIDVDWGFVSHDRWRKMTQTDRVKFYADFSKKFISSGIKDLTKHLASSARAWQMFAEAISCVRIAPQLSGSLTPVLAPDGIIVLPMLTTDVLKAPSWGQMADEVLQLRVEEEKALVKAQTTIEKTGCGGLAIQVDWSFLDDPALLRGKEEKRIGLINTLTAWIKSGIGGRKG